jgi:Tfp pilus assembly ATPase PilU
VQFRDLAAERVPLPRQRLRAAAERGMVVRTIASEIPNFEKLDLPEVLKDVVMTKRGLVLVVGGTGSGKSTTLAAMIDYRNAIRPATSSRSKTRSNTSTRTRTAWSRTAKSASTPTPGTTR